MLLFLIARYVCETSLVDACYHPLACRLLQVSNRALVSTTGRAPVSIPVHSFTRFLGAALEKSAEAPVRADDRNGMFEASLYVDLLANVIQK